MLLDVIVTYIRVLSKEGRAKADQAIADQDPAIQAALKASFNDQGKLIKKDGSRYTPMELLSLGVMPI